MRYRNWIWETMKYKPESGVRTVALLCSLFFPIILPADDLSSECRPLEIADTAAPGQMPYGEGLLWEINREGVQPSYLFGTIHITDPEITNLPEPVSNQLNQAGLFVMEALPDPDQVMQLTGMMFLAEGRQLGELIAPALFTRTIEILAGYQIPLEAASIIKPWAAFMVMNYPPGNALVMDLKMLQLAQENGIAVAGLETLQEQGKIFDELALATQLRLLTDTVCHYDRLQEDFGLMKSLYSKRDLQGLYELSRRYKLSEEAEYQELMKKLLTDRNITMAERMQPILEEGNAFIAIGAMHLAGAGGVLSLLEQRGYAIKLIY